MKKESKTINICADEQIADFMSMLDQEIEAAQRSETKNVDQVKSSSEITVPEAELIKKFVDKDSEQSYLHWGDEAIGKIDDILAVLNDDSNKLRTSSMLKDIASCSIDKTLESTIAAECKSADMSCSQIENLPIIEVSTCTGQK